jgi:hypothetical protein
MPRNLPAASACINTGDRTECPRIPWRGRLARTAIERRSGEASRESPCRLVDHAVAMSEGFGGHEESLRVNAGVPDARPRDLRQGNRGNVGPTGSRRIIATSPAARRFSSAPHNVASKLFSGTVSVMTRLRTDAWLLRGISSIPGELVLQGGHLMFRSRGSGSAWPWQFAKLERLLEVSGYAKAAEAGNPFQWFKWPVPEVEVVVPWYYFGGGIKLARNGQRLRFSFGSPANTGPNLAATFENLREVGVMRSRGRLWANAIAQASRTPRDAGTRR